MLLEHHDPAFHMAASQVLLRRLGIAGIGLAVALFSPVATAVFIGGIVFAGMMGLALFGLMESSPLAQTVPRVVDSQMHSNSLHPNRGFIGGLFRLSFDAVLPG